ncbi:MAG: tetratricopeptide repeat protein, partial [Candidatus Odinarchaeota archaeon]
MENIPEWYSDFFQLLPEREQESIDLQIEFDRSQRTEKLPPLQEMAEACIKLYRDKKIRSPHAAYLTGRLGNNAGMDKPVIDLADRFSSPELKLWKANSLMMKGDYSGAKEIFEECEKKISQDTPYAYLELKIFKINIVIATNEYELGLKENDELRDLIDFISRQTKGSINTDYFAVRGDSERVQILLQLGKMQEAQELVDKLKSEVESIQNLELRLSVYLILALYHHAMRDIQTAKSIFDKSIAISQNIGAKYEVAFITGVLGAIAFSEGDKETGEKMLLEAIDMMEEFESLWDVIQFSMALSFQYMVSNRLKDAYRLVKRIDRFLDRTEEVTIAFSNAIATIAIENEDLQLARKYLDKSRFVLIENPSKMYEIDLYYLEGALETVKLNLGTATTHVEKGLKTAESANIFPQVLSGKIRFAELNLDKWIQRESTTMINIASDNLTDALLILPADSPTYIRLTLIKALVEVLKGFNFSGALDLLEDVNKR